jgi:hypothetical protein
MAFIHYSGIGCKESEIHSIQEFLDIMKHAPSHYYEMTSLGFDMEYKTYLLPDDFINFTLEEWIDYTGAEYYENDLQMYSL